ncbi:MAG: helix-turn-helix domain-containing protein [Alphaproteobacteria bacterium]
MQPITCSVDDAAKAIGIGRVTLYKYINEGRVESIRVGGRRLVKIESVKRLVGAE